MPITAIPELSLCGIGVLLVFGAPCQLPLLAGPEHGRTIPLSDIRSRAMNHAEVADNTGRRAVCPVQDSGAGAGLVGARPIDCRGRPARAACALREGTSHGL